jgi:hypothetical protein
VHTTVDVLPALRVAAAAMITPRWCSRCSTRGLLMWTTRPVTSTTGPMLFPRRCGQLRSMAALTQLSSSCKLRWARKMPKAVTRDSGSTPALMSAQEGHTEQLAAGTGADQGGLRQGHDEQRRNACFRGGLETAHGHDAGAGECFRQSRTGTNNSTS